MRRPCRTARPNKKSNRISLVAKANRTKLISRKPYDAWRSGHSRAHPVCAGATQAARHIEPRRSRAISGSRVEPEVPGGAHLLLCGWIAGVRSRRSHGRRHRQCTQRHPGPARQGGEGPQRDAVAAVARHSTRLLAAGPATASSASKSCGANGGVSTTASRRGSAAICLSLRSGTDFRKSTTAGLAKRHVVSCRRWQRPCEQRDGLAPYRSSA